MNAELERLEVEPAILCDDELPVEHRTARQLRLERLEQLGKVAVQRFLITALDQDLLAIAEDQRAKSIPLRLEDPAFTGRQLANSLGEHRQDRRVYGKAHVSSYSQ